MPVAHATMAVPADCETVGFVCPTDHPVFASVAEALEARGYRVEFVDPHVPPAPARLDDFAFLVDKEIWPVAFETLRRAARIGLATWNGFVTTTLLNARLVTLHALEVVGCRTPAVTFEKPDGDYVAKRRFAWDGEPELCGEGDFYEPRLRAAPVDYKYYAVDTGETVEVAVRTVTSKLTGEKRSLGAVAPDPELAAAVRRLVGRLGAGGIGVDFVRTDDGFYAVDANPAPGFYDVDFETHILRSLLARLDGV